MLSLAADIEAQLPLPLDLEKASVVRNPFAALPSGHDNSLGTVLAQVRDVMQGVLRGRAKQVMLF